MSNKAIDALAVCPFYVRETKQSIVCEGIVGATNISMFKSYLDKAEHERNFCTDKCCKGCAVYSAIMVKYDDLQAQRKIYRH